MRALMVSALMLASCAPTVIPEPVVYTGKDFAWLKTVSFDDPPKKVEVVDP